MGVKAPPDLIVAGASARAAAYSAARAGFRPYWIDEFGDLDLQRAFPGRHVEPAHYPAGLAAGMASAPAAPWLYTGALENHLDAMQRMQSLRRLLGNSADTCRRVRDPVQLRDRLVEAGLLFPDLAAAVPDGRERWLMKPLRSSGGLGIGFAMSTQAALGYYLQRYIEGSSRSAVFIGNGEDAVLAGVTEQLIGRTEFHAGSFCYCGSIGPLQVDTGEVTQWRAIGSVLARGFGLRGLFGVDAVVSEGSVIVVEVNPRYTASVEALEMATGLPLVRHHVQACDGVLPVIDRGAARVAGKAYLFAPRDLVVPKNGLLHAASEGKPRFADVPHPGTAIRAGAPILTVLVEAGDAEACARLLSQQARGVYGVLLQE